MAKVIDSKIPAGPVPEKWKEYKAHQRLVNPKNKLKLDVIWCFCSCFTRRDGLQRD